jgi:diguanylate cyclase (GGDEF)-like protein
MPRSGASAQEIVAEVGATIASSIVLEDVMATVVRQIGEALGAATCDIHEYDGESDLLTFVANWAVNEDPAVFDYLGTSFPPSDRPSFLPVVRERRSIEMHIDDPDLPDLERREMKRWNDLTTLDTPLVFGDEVIGVLGLTETRVRHYTDDERRLFTQLAVLAAIAIHNARMFRRQDEQNRHLSSLLDASRAVTSTVELDEVLALIAGQAVALGCASCAIYELAEDGGALLLRSGSGREAAVDAATDDEAVTGSGLEMALAGEIVVERATDASLPAARRSALVKRGVGVLLSVPLVYGGDVRGLMEFVGPEDGRRFTAAELELARALGEQAAAAIENARLYQTLRHQAVTDGLTALYNFRYFNERLQEETARALRYDLPLSLIMLDIDDFKAFNDRHGHQAGDEALRAVGRILSTRLRQHVDIPARYGGEEFVVILPSTGIEAAASGDDAAPAAGHIEGAAAVGERLRRQIEDESPTAGLVHLPQPITVSIGVAELTLHGDDADQLIAAADRALYRAKREGKNRVIVAE